MVSGADWCALHYDEVSASSTYFSTDITLRATEIGYFNYED